MPRLIPPLPPGRAGEVQDLLRRASQPGFDYFAMVVLSTVICTFGLVTNSAAVIIGGMLVAPLMSPILALSCASVVGRNRMFWAAVVSLGQGILLAVGLSAGMAWLARLMPFELLTTLPDEILARTRPSPLDLAVALAGGAAAAYALAQPNLSAALPGVAIATALLPPLCTVGIGISLGDPNVTQGAMVLFLTNFFAIAFAGIATFGLVGLQPTGFEGNLRALVIPAALVLAITVPLVALTTAFVRQVQEGRALEEAVRAEVMKFPQAQLVEVASSPGGESLGLEVTIRSPIRPEREQVIAFQDQVAYVLQRPVALVLTHIPITKLDPQDPPQQPASAVVTPSPSPSPSPAPTPTPTPTESPAPAPTWLPFTS